MYDNIIQNECRQKNKLHFSYVCAPAAETIQKKKNIYKS